MWAAVSFPVCTTPVNNANTRGVHSRRAGEASPLVVQQQQPSEAPAVVCKLQSLCVASVVFPSPNGHEFPVSVLCKQTSGLNL